ncbi:2'-5' RNA ligase family protein [Pontibacter vulgaris]|uniref:2'-5' RNA ligase family protein n=1 Tax=Pontibacter vulgaris TaxID=2905679 RepID=UPI001FA731FD|nr:2'-5' RNA ligase family protein [Pontibacter vulgaris]
MVAITSLLDPKHSELVTELTELMELKFGIKGVKMTPYPHLTLLTAEIADKEELREYLEQLCLETPTFTVRTTGLGIFPGAYPVIYVPVLRTPPLNLLHARLHRDISEMSIEMGIHYSPNTWLPHISLALGDTSQELLGPILDFLSNYNFNWEIKLDNLTILQKRGDYFLKDEEFHFGRPALIH